MTEPLTPQELYLENIWEGCEEQRDNRVRARREKPLVRIWDGDWKLKGRVEGELDASFSWKLNDTGSGIIRLPVDHWIARWALDIWGRPTENIHITMDKDGARWGGRLRRGKLVKAADGTRHLELQFLHDYEQLKRIQVWSNPFLPAAIQFPRVSIMAGPSAWVLKTMLLMNIVRLNASLWHLPDDPLNPASWGGGFDPSNWPIVVAPGALSQDSSPWTIVSSRFKFWHDMAESTLADAELMVECRRYLEGDPEPWAGANLRNGTLIVDIVDKSGRWDMDGFGSRGSLLTGILRTFTQLADNLIDDTQVLIPEPAVVPEYQQPNRLGTTPRAPYVVYRDGAITGVEAAEFTWEPQQAVQVNGGGHSMPGVNEGISAAVQLAGNTLGQFVFVPTLGTIADEFLRPIYSDTILAWMSFKSPLRSIRAGWDHYEEHFAKGADRAYTLSGLVAMREGFWETRARTSHQLTIADGAPWFVGDQGKGHFFLGDRIASTVIGLPEHQLVVEQVGELEYSWDRKSQGWGIVVGDPRSNESPTARAIREVSELVTAVHDLGVV